MNNVFLIGFMGSGKSTVASCLSRNYGMDVIEMDEVIAKREKMSIPDIFAQKGEAYFRDTETRLLKEIEEEGHKVVSCGGGVILREENVQEMKKKGQIVLLSAEPETILERVEKNNDRPLLAGKKDINSICRMMEERRPKYEAAADLVITTDGKTAEAIAKEIEEGV